MAVAWPQTLPWIVDAAKVAAARWIIKLGLLNDLEANAYGIATLQADVISPSCRRDLLIREGNAAVISAGTGLGEAGMFWDGTALRPFAGEGRPF